MSQSTADRDTTCPVREDFDPLAPEFIADPFGFLCTLREEAPVFYAPSIGYYVATRYADIESIFLDSDTYSAAAAQVPVVPLVPEAALVPVALVPVALVPVVPAALALGAGRDLAM